MYAIVIYGMCLETSRQNANLETNNEEQPFALFITFLHRPGNEQITLHNYLPIPSTGSWAHMYAIVIYMYVMR